MGDRYDGVPEGDTTVSEKWMITKWSKVVILDSVSIRVDEGNKEVGTSLLGTIAASGDRIDNGTLFMNGFESGKFNMTWKAGSVSSSAVAFLRAKEANDVAGDRDQRRRINGIVVPAGRRTSSQPIPTMCALSCCPSMN